MKVYLDCDELYPYFGFTLENDGDLEEAEITKNTLTEWQEAMSEFRRVQKEMKRLHDKEAKRKADELHDKEDKEAKRKSDEIDRKREPK